MVRRDQSRTVNFEASARQFSFLESSLVYDSSEQQKSIYDSYNAEVKTVQISSIKLENASDTYSEFNTINFILQMNMIDISCILLLQRGFVKDRVSLH